MFSLVRTLAFSQTIHSLAPAFFASVFKLRFSSLAFLLVFFVNFLFFASFFTSVFFGFCGFTLVDDASVFFKYIYS